LTWAVALEAEVVIGGLAYALLDGGNDEKK